MDQSVLTEISKHVENIVSIVLNDPIINSAVRADPSLMDHYTGLISSMVKNHFGESASVNMESRNEAEDIIRVVMEEPDDQLYFVINIPSIQPLDYMVCSIQLKNE